MAEDNRSVKDRLERRKLLGAIGASPLAAAKLTKDKDSSRNELVNQDLKKVNTTHYITSELTHESDIPGTLLGDHDGWLEYTFTGKEVILNELSTAQQRELFSESPSLVNRLNGNIGEPPIRVSEAPINVLQVEAPDNSTQGIGLSKPYEPPNATIEVDQNNSVILKQEERDDEMLGVGEKITIECDKSTIFADNGEFQSEFEVKPLIKVANYGKIPIYQKSGSNGPETELSEPFVIGESDNVEKTDK